MPQKSLYKEEGLVMGREEAWMKEDGMDGLEEGLLAVEERVVS